MERGGGQVGWKMYVYAVMTTQWIMMVLELENMCGRHNLGCSVLDVGRKRSFDGVDLQKPGST